MKWEPSAGPPLALLHESTYQRAPTHMQAIMVLLLCIT
eukprot:COSAG01_NODE_54283_length_333_cov_0.666667_2_plen_37_part_01